MNMNWSINHFKDGEEQNINNLFNEVFKKSRSIEHWEWKYKKNPRGFKALIAVSDKKVVGHLGALNRSMKIGNSEHLASLEVDGMTHPEYGRKGIFVGLGENLLNESKNEGIKIVYGFPNENAIAGHRKLKCTELFKLHIMIRPLDFSRISKRMFPNRILGFLFKLGGKLTFKLFYRPKKPPVSDNIEIKAAHGFDSRFDGLWEMAKDNHKVILERGSSYLNWRYHLFPKNIYTVYVAEENGHPVAWIALRIMDRFGLKNGAIVDMLALPEYESALHKLINKSVGDLEQRGVDLVACSIPKTSLYYKIFRKCGFMTCPKSLNPQEELFIIYPLSEEIDSSTLKEPSHWFITWGDTDVV